MSGTLKAFIDLAPQLSDFQDDILSGLSATPKTASAKFFYDSEGSRLFDQICTLEAYYQTRTECGILADQAEVFRQSLPAKAAVIEFGSGSDQKINLLTAALPSVSAYVPIDISKQYLIDTASNFAANKPEIAVSAICADFMQHIDLNQIVTDEPRIGFFPGSTIGNLNPPEAMQFLRNAAKTLGAGGYFVIGVDLKKDPQRLIDAYDDDQGVTAAFNLNLLARINRELDGTFESRSFQHKVVYVKDPCRIEMHLESCAEQEIKIAGQTFHFSKGETIHTENCHKFEISEFQKIAADAGFIAEQVLTDPGKLFSIHILRVA